MMPFAISVLLALGGGLPAAGVIPHMAWAERLVRDIKPADNAYGSRPTVLQWRGVDGAIETRNRTVCSSFITRLLKQAYGHGTDDIKRWFGSASPTADLYYQAISSGNGFKQIASISLVKVGDLIAIDYHRGQSADYESPSQSTGHVMLVAGQPMRLEGGSEGSLSRYSVLVIDSSRSGHGLLDTRRQANGGWGTGGVGRGEIGLQADGQGRIHSYSWSNLSRSKVIPQTQHSLLIGRFCGSEC